jgi:hypothetical protein
LSRTCQTSGTTFTPSATISCRPQTNTDKFNCIAYPQITPHFHMHAE